MARQHRTVDRRDLVRQRLNARGVDGEVGIEQVREANAVGLGDEPQQRAVAVERPRTTGLDQLERGFLVAIDEAVGDGAGRILVGDLGGLITEPLDMNDLGRPAGSQPANESARL